MAPSGGMRVSLAILLLQVFSATEYASAQDYAYQFSSGQQVPESRLRVQSLGDQYPGPEVPFWYPPTISPGPTFSEDDLTCLIGQDLEVPYPLYKQISDSFLSTTNILVLLPNNTIVQVAGYVGLKDIIKVDPDDTKVLISSEEMIPASIYLRIVLVQPEEVMIRLPQGQILPYQIYQERYGEKLKTHYFGGQRYFESVRPEDFIPFIVINNRRGDSAYVNYPSFVPDSQRTRFPVGGAVAGSEPAPVPFDFPYPEPAPYYPEPEPVPKYTRPQPVRKFREPLPSPHNSQPQASPRYSEPAPAPQYPEPFPYHPKEEPAQQHPRPQQESAAPTYVKRKRSTNKQNACLPCGQHIIETCCCICGQCDHDVPHVTVFTV